MLLFNFTLLPDGSRIFFAGVCVENIEVFSLADDRIDIADRDGLILAGVEVLEILIHVGDVSCQAAESELIFKRERGGALDSALKVVGKNVGDGVSCSHQRVVDICEEQILVVEVGIPSKDNGAEGDDGKDYPEDLRP